MRHNAYGIGALTYFRRVIEDTTDEMLDLLEKAMLETKADPGAVDRLRKVKDGTRFEDKVHIAAEVMPPHARPDGVNPFCDLYGIAEHRLAWPDRDDGIAERRPAWPDR